MHVLVCSPLPDVSTALYRFEDPAVPAFLLPEAQPISPGDIQLNVDNPITDLDGSETDTGCNGDIVSISSGMLGSKSENKQKLRV